MTASRRSTRQQRRSAAIDLSRAPVGTPLRATEAQPKIQLLQRQQTPSPADDSVEDLSAERRDSGVAGWSSSLPVEERDNMAGTALRKESGVFLNVFSDGELSRPSSRVVSGRSSALRGHLVSASPMSLEDFIKPQSGNQRDRSRSKTITTASSDDRLSSYPYASDIEHLVETSSQKPEEKDDGDATAAQKLDEGYAETFDGVGVTVQKPEEHTLSGSVRTYTRPDGVVVSMQWSPTQRMWVTLENHNASKEQTTDVSSSEVLSSNVFGFTKGQAANASSQPRSSAFEHVQPLNPVRAPERPSLSARTSETCDLRRTVLHDPFGGNQSSLSMPHHLVSRPGLPQRIPSSDYAGPNRAATTLHGPGYATAPVKATQTGPLPIGSNRPRPGPPARNGSKLNAGREVVLSDLTDAELRALYPLVPHALNTDSYLSEEPGRPKEVDIETFWQSGLHRRARHKEYIDCHFAASGKVATQGADAVMGVFVPMFENLHWYSTQKSLNNRQITPPARWNSGAPAQAPAGNRDYFARFVEPPEWCIDRNMALGSGKSTFGESKVQTFFGELEWVKAPERVGRDPRYRPMLSGTNSSEAIGRRAKMSGSVFGPTPIKNIPGMPVIGRFG